MAGSAEANLGEIISLAQASKLTGYNQDYLGQLCRSGKLKGTKFGRNWTTTVAAINELLRQNGFDQSQLIQAQPAEPTVISSVQGLPIALVTKVADLPPPLADPGTFHKFWQGFSSKPNFTAQYVIAGSLVALIAAGAVVLTSGLPAKFFGNRPLAMVGLGKSVAGPTGAAKSGSAQDQSVTGQSADAAANGSNSTILQGGTLTLGQGTNITTTNNGSGTITLATVNNPTFSTSVTSPLVIGGTTATSPLTLRSTSGVGAGGADIIFQTGNNGATEAIRILNSGNVGIGTASPASLLSVGSLSQFQVNASGAIAAATGVTSSGTITFSGLNTDKGLLYANGSGVLAQTAQGAGGSCGSGATATAVLTGDAVTSVTVVCGGNGYGTAPTVSFSGGGGSGAAATAVLTGDAVTAVNVTSGGSGYSSPPAITFGNVSGGGGGAGGGGGGSP
jgi:hypothetical protein